MRIFIHTAHKVLGTERDREREGEMKMNRIKPNQNSTQQNRTEQNGMEQSRPESNWVQTEMSWVKWSRVESQKPNGWMENGLWHSKGITKNTTNTHTHTHTHTEKEIKLNALENTCTHTHTININTKADMGWKVKEKRNAPAHTAAAAYNTFMHACMRKNWEWERMRAHTARQNHKTADWLASFFSRVCCVFPHTSHSLFSLSINKMCKAHRIWCIYYYVLYLLCVVITIHTHTYAGTQLNGTHTDESALALSNGKRFLVGL